MNERIGDSPITDEQEQSLIVGRTYKVNAEGYLEPSTDPGPVLSGLKRAFNWLVVATVALSIALGGVAFFSYSTSAQNKQAVCNLRTDLQRRIASSEEFIVRHPDAVKKLGFTVTQVQKEIDNQRRTLSALNAVNCD